MHEVSTGSGSDRVCILPMESNPVATAPGTDLADATTYSMIQLVPALKGAKVIRRDAAAKLSSH